MAKNKKVTPEEVEERQYNAATRSLNLIPEPTYEFSIGERVVVGALDCATVEDVMDGGKIYKIRYEVTKKDRGSGKEVTTYGHINFFEWMSVRPLPTNDDNLLSNEDIFITNMNQEIASILGKVYSFGVDFNPRYQREYVWGIYDERKLINSIFSNIDIGKFVFIHNEYKDGDDFRGYTIVDGKQRINALCRYYENKFNWGGYYYNDLSHHMQSHFKSFLVAVGEVRNITEEQEIRLFLMLNEGGLPQSETHLKYVRSLLPEN